MGAGDFVRLEADEELVNEALEATTIQRALGFSYKTVKAFQPVVVTVVRVLVPAP